MTRPRHLPAADDSTPDTYNSCGVCGVCGDEWPCWDERIDRIVDRLPSAAEIPPETRAKLTILLRPSGAARV